MLVTLVAFLAGALSVLTPCVLPLLPAILAVSAQGGRRRVLGLVLGIVSSFAIALLAFTWAVSQLGVPQDALRWFAVAVLLAAGTTMLVPALERRFELFASGLVSRFSRGGPTTQSTGFAGGLAAGTGLGLVWAPCVGPIIAGVAATIAQDEFSAETVVHVVAFSAGMSIPLALIAIGGRRMGTWFRDKVGGRRLSVATGVILLLTAGFLATGLDNDINRWLAENTDLQAGITASLEEDVLFDDPDVTDESELERNDDGELVFTKAQNAAADGYPELGQLADLGPMPPLEGTGRWYNIDGEELGPEDFEGKVVLVDFWTYSCINCIRTLPYLRAWHDKYADDGLVILGVHSPEFEFEKDAENVAAAIEDFEIEYPVVQDNEFATWRNYYNRFWPAKYLVDRDGTVRYAHYGEGDYEVTEELIQDLLDVEAEVETDQGTGGIAGQTHETYLGYQRAANFVGGAEGNEVRGFSPDREVTYTGPDGAKTAADLELEQDQWTYLGNWTVEDERAVAGSDAELVINYNARDVFLVFGPAEDAAEGTVVRSTDNFPGGTTSEHEVRRQTLYTLRDTDELNNATMRIQVPQGVAVYAFTFG